MEDMFLVLKTIYIDLNVELNRKWGVITHALSESNLCFNLWRYIKWEWYLSLKIKTNPLTSLLNVTKSGDVFQHEANKNFVRLNNLAHMLVQW